MERKKLIEDEGERLWELTMQDNDGEIAPEYLWVVEYLREKEAKITITGLIGLQEFWISDYDCLNLPASVVVFFDELIRQKNSMKVLDPLGGLGLLGAYLSLNEKIKQVDVVNHLKEANKLLDPFNLPRFKMHTDFSNLQSPYDAVVSIPYYGMQKKKKTFTNTDGNQIEIIDIQVALMIAHCVKFLSQNGFIAFLMPPEFKLDTRKSSLRKNLEKFDLHLSALLSFKPGIFADTKTAFDLAIIEKKKYDTLFVAEVPEDEKAQKELISRLKKRIRGANPGQGMLVSEDEFFGLPALEAKDRAARLAKKKKLFSYPFSQVVNETQSPILKGKLVVVDFAATSDSIPVELFGRFADHPDAVYLPTTLLASATVRQDDLVEGSYFQLMVNTEIVIPDYLSWMLNSDLGHALRESIMTGLTMPKIRRSLLQECVLYLPPLDDQQKAVKAMSLIQKLENELSEHRSKILEHPREVSAVIESLGNINHDDLFKDWVETLPFPLASILRSYYAIDKTNNEKCTRLYKFFLAFAQFCAVIHLSAFRSNSIYWEPLKNKLRNEIHPKIDFPAFGMWCNILANISGEVQSLIDENQAFIKSLYATADTIPLDMLSSKKLVSLLFRTSNFRNDDTEGHGGTKDTYTESAIAREQLEKELELLREIVGTKFLQYQLIEPGENKILPGPIYQFRVRSVMGSNALLENKSIEITEPAIAGALYMHNPEHNRVLKLIPLIQIRDAPQPSGYFYNKGDKPELKFASYSLADKANISVVDPEIVELINEFINEPGGYKRKYDL